MLFVLDKGERIINIFNNAVKDGNIFYNDKLVRDLTTGASTFTFTTTYNEKNSGTLEVGNYIAFNDEESDEYLLFQIMNIEYVHGESFEINVYCECAGLSLINSILRKITIPSCDIKKFLTTCLQDTEWEVGFIDITLNNVLDLSLETASVYSILQNNVKNFDAELNFRCVIENGKISKKYIDAFRTRGRKVNKRFEFGRNIQSIKRTIDSSELYTALIGIGNNDINFKDVSLPEIPNKPVGQDFVYDQDSFNRYNNKGYHIMGIFKYNTNSPEELLRKTYLKLQELKKPHITYEVNVELLGANIQIGDTIPIIDDYFNPPLLLEARVNQLTTSLTNPTENKCVLSNFVEVDSDISIELLEKTKEIVDNSIGSKFPIGTNDIKNKAVTGIKIVENSISTDHLRAGVVTAEKIQSNSIKARHIQARQINASHIEVGTITAENMKTHTITAESGIIADATIGTMQLQDGAITNAKIAKLAVGEANIINASITDAKIKNLDASKIVSGDIDGDRIKANVINAINTSIGNAVIKSAKIENLDASKIVTGFISADRIKAGDITGDKLAIDSISAKNIQTGAITSDKIYAGAITGDKLAINSITSDKIVTGAITGDKLQINSVTADKIQTNSIDSSKIKAGSIDTNKLTAETINSLKIGAKDLVVDNIKSGNIKVSNINILDGSISGTKIAKASISNAQISSAFVADAYIKSITADKIIGGTFDAKNITVKNLSADSITVGKINGNQIQSGAISKEKLDQNLNGVIKNTIDNVDNILKSVGLLSSNIKDVNKTLATKVTVGQVQDSINTSLEDVNKKLTNELNNNLTIAKTYTDNSINKNSTELNNKISQAENDLKKYSEQVSIAKSNLAAEQAKAYADGIISKEEKARIDQAKQNLDTAIAKVEETKKLATNLSNQAKAEAIKNANDYTNNAKNDAIKQATNLSDSAKNQAISTAKTYADNVSETKKNQAIQGARTIPDTRNDNQSPSWYIKNYPRQTITEFKFARVIQIPNIKNSADYGTLETKIPWNDTSGGYPTQTFRSNNYPTYQRYGINETSWSEWEQIEDIKGSQQKANKALNDSKTYTDNVKKELNNRVVSIANGKNTIFYSDNQPPTSGRINNDIWFDTNDGYRMYKFINNSWVATQFGTNAISANSITGDKITTSAITAGKIASGAVTSDKIYANAITSDKVAANAITAGKIATNAVTAANIVAGAISTDKLSANSITSDKLNIDQLFVGDNAFISKLKALEIDASNITTGTISGDRIDINGLVGFNSLDKDLQGMFNNQGGKTYINGGMIETNTINASAINIKGNLFIQNNKGETTFAVADDGNVSINGLLESSNFEEDKEGYKITTDGHAEFNDVKVRGDVILPNAGITNYGAMIEKENLLTGTKDFVGWTKEGSFVDFDGFYNGLKVTKATGDWNYYYKDISLTEGKVYTLSAFVKCNSKNMWVAFFGYNGGGEGRFNFPETNKWFRYKYTFVAPKSGSVRVRLETGGINGTGKSLCVCGLKLVQGNDTNDKWCPSSKDNINFVRFFAGADYENRDNAPFRVYQDGSMFATNGTFAGRIIGHYDSGKVHIKDDEIIINNKNVMVANGTIITDKEDFSHPFIKLSPTQSIINTNFLLGSLDNKRIEFLNNERVLNVFDGGINLFGKYKNINIGKENGNEHHILTTNSIYGGQHNIKYLDNQGGLVFEALGSNNADIPYDFNFTRPDKNTIVKIDGTINISKSLKAQNNNIEMQFKDDGWGFYAI